MILDLNQGKSKIARKLHWKQEIRFNIYMRNKEKLKKKVLSESKKDQKHQKRIQRQLLRFIKSGIQQMRIRDDCHLSSPHSYYSFFIPLQIQTKFQNELTIAFPFIKRLQQTGRIQERRIILNEIAQQMKNAVEKGEADKGWMQCLQKYICELDTLRALEVYFQVKKRGGLKSSGQLHREFGGKCLPRIFFQRYFIQLFSLQWCRDYLHPSLSITSIQQRREVTEITMPMTMKNLFCWICLLYDCTQHSEDESLCEKDYHFAAPNNLIPQNEQIAKATTLCVQYHHLIAQGSVPKGRGGACSPKCYKYLTSASWEQLQARRGTLLNPIVKAVVKMGIHMYSYSPCQLWLLLTDKGITCDLAFLFLVEDYNLRGRLQRKLQSSQAEALLRIDREEGIEVKKTIIRKGRKKKQKIVHNEHSCQITACVHYFLTEGAIDKGCQACACRKRNFCLPQCLCDSNCQLRKKGCHCRKDDCRTEKCPCRRNNEECDPALCLNCFNKPDCKNHQILQDRSKRVRVGKSTIQSAGLGLFSREQIKQEQLVTIYSGELIDDSIDLLRELLSIDNAFYNFSSKQGTIDARFRGNCARFINHDDQGRQNLYAQQVLSGGRYKVGFFAKRHILPGEQLFFDYDGTGKLYKYYQEKYPFIHKKKNKPK